MNQKREIPDWDNGNPFVSIGEILEYHKDRPQMASIATLATAIEQVGIYAWDRYGRFKHFSGESEYASKALELLALVHAYESDTSPHDDYEDRHPLDEASDWQEDNPYLRYGWAKEVLPDFEAISIAGFGEVKRPASAQQRRMAVGRYVDDAFAQRIAKKKSYEELAARGQFGGVENVKRLYQEYRKGMGSKE